MIVMPHGSINLLMSANDVQDSHEETTPAMAHVSNGVDTADVALNSV